MKLGKEETKLIEAIASSMQGGGLPKASGSILGYLMICNLGQASFEEIMKDLKLSKGSVSQSLNLLQSARLAEMIKEGGVRKRYYRLCNPAHEQFIESRIQGIKQTQALFQQAKKLNTVAGRNHQKKVLDDIIQFNGFMEKELIAIKKKWIS